MSTTPVMPVVRKCPYVPPEEHVRLREEEPVAHVTFRNGMTGWVLTRYEDIRRMLTDPRFSSDLRKPNFPLLQPGGPPPGDFRPSLIAMDPPEHGEARRAVLGEFTVKRLAALRPRIQEIVDRYIDAMLAGPRPVDLVEALALPVPSLVICELLGVSYDDRDFFQSRATTILHTATPLDERMNANIELFTFLDELITRKEQEPGDDLLTRQLEKTTNRGELIALAALLLVAGHETTANMISLGTMTLLEHPDALAAIREEPARTPGAIEELLRYFTIAESAAARLATEDIEIGGVTIRAGDGVVALSNTGNHDPARFDKPDEFDIEREDARHHIAFGYGAHQCLGQNLARLELQIVFGTLLRRIPALRLATPFDELRFKDTAGVYGLHELPVTW